ncbi:hypothetical protein [Pseudomonas sp. PS02290]|uniref:hypothetical protein n=1 Tax=Pseudomonas sp. PS02290 TaxID=2991430 RepID=UPI00249B235C|nr:hypothetical protein [Pseudomonas sp. PS02290]
MDYPKSVPNVGLVGGKFVDENVATGVVGSLIPSAWGNSVTDELLAVIKAAGFEPAEGNSAQLLAAIKALRGGQLFTSSGLFVVPAGIYRIWVSACAGGSAGAGGGGATNTTGTGGGGAGGSAGQSILWRAFDVVPGQVISITIGVGGIGGTGGGPTTGGGPGSVGGATVIGTLVTLLGAPPSAGGANC